jgi:rifampicin phosphotransferase
MLVITKKSIPQFVAKEAGGKGGNLYFLSRQGLNVPDWYVFGKRFYNRYLKETNIEESIQNIMSDAPDSHSKDYDIGIWAKRKSLEVTELMMNTPFPKDMLSLFTKQYNDFNKNCLAVRSSAIDEDSATHSFAGQLSSFLYLKDCESYLIAIKECWASGFSERGLVYRVKNGLTVTNIQVAVVVQEMIDPDKSGVAFSCDPINENPEKILINSVYGVGEGLVSGLLDADTYMLNKSDLAVEQEEIVEKKRKLTRDPNGGHIEVDVLPELVEASSLSKAELISLGEVVKKIEDLYHFPQDIEWAIKDGKIYLLQARPVTTPVRARLGTLYIWDNSNIVESYGGLTMPLTFGFARYVYHQVYLQFCEILMVPYKHIKQMDFFLTKYVRSVLWTSILQPSELV